MYERFRIGTYFLDRRPNSPSWCACWYDPETRQTRRTSLRTTDFQEATLRLARFVTNHETLRDVRQDEMLLETILVRYYEHYARNIKSAVQARIALGIWSDHFAGLQVSDLTPQRVEAFIIALRAKGYKNSYISRILSVGRAALKRAWKRGELTSVPFVKTPPVAITLIQSTP